MRRALRYGAVRGLIWGCALVAYPMAARVGASIAWLVHPYLSLH